MVDLTLVGQAALGLVAGLVLLWAALVVLLWRARPEGSRLSEAVAMAPDLLRLLRRLVADGDVRRGVRLRVGLLLAYLLSPIDLIPDFIPVLGYADDAIVTVIALRSIVRRAGPHALERHWPGSPSGLRAVQRLAGVAPGGRVVGDSSTAQCGDRRGARRARGDACGTMGTERGRRA